jgi:hypothetical protein
MKRVDQYPDVESSSKGISPWFRLGLAGTYHRGIMVGYRWDTLTKDGDGWRLTDDKAGEQGDVRVMMISNIPYENIESVDWDGDEYYNFPHIYCWFSRKKEPYEYTAFYTKTEPPVSLPFYTEVAPADDVRHRSKKHGGKRYIG